jgi:hypothetical protein
MSAELYKIFIKHEDEVTGLGKQWTTIKRVYAYQYYGKTYLGTNQRIAEQRNREEARRIERRS